MTNPCFKQPAFEIFGCCKPSHKRKKGVFHVALRCIELKSVIIPVMTYSKNLNQQPDDQTNHVEHALLELFVDYFGLLLVTGFMKSACLFLSSGKEEPTQKI